MSLTSGLSDGSSEPQQVLESCSIWHCLRPYLTMMYPVRRYFQPVCGILMAKLAKEAGERRLVCKSPGAPCLYLAMICTHPCS